MLHLRKISSFRYLTFLGELEQRREDDGMMVNCPKCGFSQPQDQYCASCGVDMVAFRARTRASQSLLKNPVVQVLGFVVVVIASFVFVRASNNSRVEHLVADTPVVREADQQERELAAAQSDQGTARAEMNETNSASVKSPTVESERPSARTDQGDVSGGHAGEPAFSQPALSATLPSAGASKVTPAAGIRAALQPPQNVKVYFIEAQRSFLTELLSDAREPSSDGTVAYGVVADLDQRLKNSRAWQSLDTSSDQPMKLNQPNVIFKGTRDPASGQNIGFAVQVIPLSRDEAGSHLQIDANRTLRDSSNGIESVNFQMPENFSIPKGSSVVITNVLPHRQIGPEEQALYRNVNVLKAMAGERFRSGATDVAIIVQAH